MTEIAHEHFERPDGVTVDLYCGDCLDVLPTLGRVDAVVTDPPYGINYSPRDITPGSMAWGGKTFYGDTVVRGDNLQFDPRPFLVFPRVVMFGANNYADRLPASTDWVIWDKRDGVSSNDFADCEMIWTNAGGVARVFRHLWMGAVRKSEKSEPRQHPTQKPIELMAWLIEKYTDSGAVVLDAYMGSGTTGVAAVRLGRSFIGIEIEPKYYAIARRRILDALAQPALFQV